MIITALGLPGEMAVVMAEVRVYKHRIVKMMYQGMCCAADCKRRGYLIHVKHFVIFHMWVKGITLHWYCFPCETNLLSLTNIDCVQSI